MQVILNLPRLRHHRYAMFAAGPITRSGVMYRLRIDIGSRSLTEPTRGLVWTFRPPSRSLLINSSFHVEG